MDVAEIQKRLDALAAGMLAKGVPEPGAHVSLRSDASPSVYLAWRSKNPHSYQDYKHLDGEIEVALAEAEKYIAALPSREQARLQAFMASLSETIELGKHSSIDADLVNPLLALMNTLSRNALTHSRAEAQ